MNATHFGGMTAKQFSFSKLSTWQRCQSSVQRSRTSALGSSTQPRRCQSAAARLQRDGKCHDILELRGTEYYPGSDDGSIKHLLQEVRRQSSRRRKAKMTEQQVEECKITRGLQSHQAWPVLVYRRQSMVWGESLRKFRRLVRKLNLVLRVFRIMKEHSKALVPLTTIELHWFQYKSPGYKSSRRFNPQAFSRPSCRIPDWLRRMLQTTYGDNSDKSATPHERSDKDVADIRALLRSSPGFSRFTRKLQDVICRILTFERVDGGRIITRQGHVSSKLYFIFSGSVFVNVTESLPDGRVITRTEHTLGRGECFGDAEFVSKGRHAMTVRCREACELLVVVRGSFIAACPSFMIGPFEEKVAFLRSLDAFTPSNTPPDALTSLCLEADAIDYLTDRVIVQDNKVEDNAYICMTGRCEVWQCLDSVPEDTASHHEANSTGSGTDEEEDVAVSKKESIHRSSQGHIEPLSSFSEEDAKPSAKPGKADECRKRSEGELIRFLLKKQQSLLQDRMQKLREGTLKPKCAETSVLTTAALLKSSSAFVQVGVMSRGDIFDSYNLLNTTDEGENTPRNQPQFLLVSCGSRVLKVNKLHFFRCLKPSALQSLQEKAKWERFPTDVDVTKALHNHHSWSNYKRDIVSNVAKVWDSRQNCRRQKSRQQTTAARAEKRREVWQKSPIKGLKTTNQILFSRDVIGTSKGSWKQAWA